jgi:membrane-associated protein
MSWIGSLVDLFLHVDQHLAHIIQLYGGWTYLILFAVVFCETGLVVTPFLPGDSLLFAAGTFAARGSMSIGGLFLLLAAAAIAGDTVNYWIGAYVGPRAFSGEIRWLKKEYLERTHRFYTRHGGKAIILARFVPIVRTFAPFVAGIGAMNYGKFIVYNVTGGLAWVALFLWGGYQFAGLQFVQKQFHWVIVAIVVISVMPMVIEYLRSRRRRPGEAEGV